MSIVYMLQAHLHWAGTGESRRSGGIDLEGNDGVLLHTWDNNSLATRCSSGHLIGHQATWSVIVTEWMIASQFSTHNSENTFIVTCWGQQLSGHSCYCTRLCVYKQNYAQWGHFHIYWTFIMKFINTFKFFSKWWVHKTLLITKHQNFNDVISIGELFSARMTGRG